MTETSQTDMLTEVLRVDKDHYKRDVVYKFGEGRASPPREYEDTDNTDSGIYDGT